MIIAKGHNGQVQFDGQTITISRKGALGFLTQGLKGDKAISITSVTAVQYKKVGAFTSGYIQFSLMGGNESRGGVFDAASDENSVMFVKKQEADFDRLRDAVQARIGRPVPSAVPVVSKLDELEKLANLRDRGVLSDEEFQAQKARLLA